MDQSRLISVVVPIYKIERYIGFCIESIMNQTYRNLEIILVDDGSPDRCPEICDLYARKDSRIRVIHKENGGLVSARKAGLLISTGEYVGYVDGDDWIEPSFYESLISVMISNGCDLVCAGFTRDLFSKSVSFLNAISPGVYFGDSLSVLKRDCMSYGSFYRPGITTYVWNKLFKRNLLLNHQINVDERISIGEDGAVTYPVIMDCGRVFVSDCVGYHYRQREDSMLKKQSGFEEELRKIRFLYNYISSISKLRFFCEKRVEEYVLSILLIRSGGKLLDEEYNMFGVDFSNKRVAIFSAGTFGQQLFFQLKKNNVCKVSGWLDDDFWEYRRCCLDVDPVERIKCIEYDYLLIATLDGVLAERLKKRFKDYGVPCSKILTIDCPESIMTKLVDCYMKEGDK